MGPLSYPLKNKEVARSLDTAEKRAAVTDAGKKLETGKTAIYKSKTHTPISADQANKKLARRIRDFEATNYKNNDGAFHRPGSNKK